MSANGAATRRRLCIVQPSPCSPSETFLRAHAERLPAEVTVIAGRAPAVNGVPIKSQLLLARAWRKLGRVLLGRTWRDEVDSTFRIAFERYRPDAVLAEYGDTGPVVMHACRKAGLPLVVHFHGYDASERACLEQMAGPYREMFGLAWAVIAVSRAMRARLIELGAPPEKVYWNPYGVDCGDFGGADPASAGPVFLAVGRFYPKKAPDLTLRAFARVREAVPEARLRMVGFGPLLEAAQALAGELNLGDSVTFLGTGTPEVVRREMRRARCFVQHSVEAPDGDCEGTPVAVIEAGASGLPVVSTRHGGIPDVVVEGGTGLLVEERDVEGMARHMIRLANDPALAARMGRAARERVEVHFSMDRQIGRLWSIIEAGITGRPLKAGPGGMAEEAA